MQSPKSLISQSLLAIASLLVLLSGCGGKDAGGPAPLTSSPLFSPAPGTYGSVQSVTLSDATAGAVIYYTVDGSHPTTGSSVYGLPISVSATTTINTMAVAPGYSQSAVSSGTYTINLPPPPAESVVYSFSYSVSGSTDGDVPESALVAGADGNFYGITQGGGTSTRCGSILQPKGCGTFFRITPPGAETVLYSFGVQPGDGTYPSSLILGDDGNFYGTTYRGGANDLSGVGSNASGDGTVFKITPSGVETILYSFSSVDPNGPGNLSQGADGNFYGVYGGRKIFKLTPTGVFTYLYDFGPVCGGGICGGEPTPSTLVQSQDGNFYGVTANDGTATIEPGEVFKMTPSGGVTVLYAFRRGTTDGGNPSAALIQGSDGNFYGTTWQGGVGYSPPNTYGYGTVFKITPDGTETILHFFSGSPDGARPSGPLIEGSDGSFYGTTAGGGATNNGTVFKITPSGIESVLYSFGAIVNDGLAPSTGVTEGSDGTLYGTTPYGGAYGGAYEGGTVFKVTNAIQK